MSPNPIRLKKPTVKDRIVIALVVTAVVIAAVVSIPRGGTDPRDEISGFEWLASVITDGSAVYVSTERLRDRSTELPSLIRRFDADGDLDWAVEDVQALKPLRTFGDGFLWAVVETDQGPTDRERPVEALIKLDTETGDILGTVNLSDEVQAPFLRDGKLWVIKGFDMTAVVIDPDTLTIEAEVDLRAGGTADPPRINERYSGGPVVSHPHIDGDTLYYVLKARQERPENWLVRYSLSERRVTNEASFNLTIWDTDLIDDQFWLLWQHGTNEIGEWGFLTIDLDRLDLDDFELDRTLTPYFTAPYGNLVTDDYIFDLVGQTETVQIDRTTGEIIHRYDDLPQPRSPLEPPTPQFILDGHLWFSDLSRRKIDTPD